MFCKYCGKEIEDSFVVCPYCGAQNNGNGDSNGSSHNDGYNSPNGYNQYNQNASDDSGSIGWGFLGFFFPIIGLILFLVWKSEKPRCAKVAGKGALISVIIAAVFYAIIIICAISGAFANANYLG